MSDFAKQKQGDDNHFESLEQALDWFLSQGCFSESETMHLKQLYEEQHRKLASIWNVYEVMKQRDDMLNSLKVLLEIKGKKAAAGGDTGLASNVPKP